MSERIEIDPRVSAGEPVIKGTQIPVAVILEKLAEGASWDLLLRTYPALTTEDIKAALRYAGDSVPHTKIAPAIAGGARIADQMKAAEKIIRRYRNTLRELAK
jgi:uncharacterized protein (DUF433 family)